MVIFNDPNHRNQRDCGGCFVWVEAVVKNDNEIIEVNGVPIPAGKLRDMILDAAMEVIAEQSAAVKAGQCQS